MDVIFNKDGTMYSIRNDTDFCRMLSECLGDDAAVWYQGRIGRVDSPIWEIRHILPPEEEVQKSLKGGRTIYDLTRLAAVGTDNLVEVAQIAYEIPGWDE